VALAGLSYRLTTLAQTGDRFRNFAPYVAAINESGLVAFQAGLAEDKGGVFVCEETGPREIVAATHSQSLHVYSHPDINDRGDLTFYASGDEGDTGVYFVSDGQCSCVVSRRPDAGRIGPLGPTLNDAGQVAFRAEDASGRCGIHSWSLGSVETIADADDQGESFDGLPVVVDSGALAFRATSRAGVSTIYLREGSRLTQVVDSAGEFCELGRFPDLNQAHQVAFVAKRVDGSCGAFSACEGVISTIVESRDGFASFRGVLLPTLEWPIFYATPVSGQLGIYAGLGSTRTRVLGIGDVYGGSEVAAFALNPVSVNSRGQLAIRIELSDGRQAIVRADPT
jgi:hypothetical protein